LRGKKIKPPIERLTFNGHVRSSPTFLFLVGTHGFILEYLERARGDVHDDLVVKARRKKA